MDPGAALEATALVAAAALWPSPHPPPLACQLPSLEDEGDRAIRLAKKSLLKLKGQGGGSKLGGFMKRLSGEGGGSQSGSPMPRRSSAGSPSPGESSPSPMRAGEGEASPSSFRKGSASALLPAIG